MSASSLAKPVDCHYFTALLSLPDRPPSQCYIVEINFTTRALSYVVKERAVHTLPFSHIIRLSASVHSLTLHVTGQRLGELVGLLHIVNERDREMLARFLSLHCLHTHAHTDMDNDSALNVSPYLLSPSLVYHCQLKKRGYWGGDATRFAYLITHKLLLYRHELSPTQPQCYPLNVVSMSDIVAAERKSAKRLKLQCQDREFEFAFDTEKIREEFYLTLETERLQSQSRIDEWQKLMAASKAEKKEFISRFSATMTVGGDDASETSQLANEFEHKCSLLHTAPLTPTHAATNTDTLKMKRRSMPSPSITAVSAHVLAAKNKRGSLSVKTQKSLNYNQNHLPLSPSLSASNSAGVLPVSPSMNRMSTLGAYNTNINTGNKNNVDEVISPFPGNNKSPMNASPSLYRSPSAPGSYLGKMGLPSPIMNGGRAAPVMPGYSPPPAPRFSQPAMPVTPESAPAFAMNTPPSLTKSLNHHHSNANAVTEYWRYTIVVRGFDEPMGQITVPRDPSLTLSHLRSIIYDEFDDVPDEFNFCDFDSVNQLVVPVSLKQERVRYLDSVSTGILYVKVKNVRGSLSDNSQQSAKQVDDSSYHSQLSEMNETSHHERRNSVSELMSANNAAGISQYSTFET